MIKISENDKTTNDNGSNRNKNILNDKSYQMQKLTKKLIRHQIRLGLIKENNEVEINKENE